MKKPIASRTDQQSAFSLVEVVLALGVISFAIVAILGILPIGLQTGHSAQDETRAAQIAQIVLSSIASQASQNFQNVALPTTSPSPAPTLDLSSSTTSPTLPAPNATPVAVLYADNNGQIILADTNPASTPPPAATFSISVFTDNYSAAPSPAPFDSGYANKVTLRIVSPPLPSASATPNPNQSVRDYVRVISKY